MNFEIKIKNDFRIGKMLNYKSWCDRNVALLRSRGQPRLNKTVGVEARHRSTYSTPSLSHNCYSFTLSGGGTPVSHSLGAVAAAREIISFLL